MIGPSGTDCNATDAERVVVPELPRARATDSPLEGSWRFSPIRFSSAHNEAVRRVYLCGEPVLVNRTHGKRARRHASIGLASLIFATLGQLALVAWLSLWAKSSSFFARPPGIVQGRTGVLVDRRADAASAFPKWIFWVQAPGFSGPFHGSGTVVFHRAWGRWVVTRFPGEEPTLSDPTPMVLVEANWIPSWASDLTDTPPTTEEIARWTVSYDYAFGWPFPAMSAGADLRAKPQQELHLRHAVMVLPPERRLPLRLNGPLGFFPTRVVWWGMGADVAVGTCVLASPFVLLAILCAARARRRIRLGLCGACGYGPWDGAAVCPECGTIRGQRSCPTAP